MQARVFDARALLNPKAAAASSTNAPPTDRWRKETTNSYENQNDPEPTFEFGSTMEKLHNVEKRSDRPVKRAKHQHEAVDLEDVDEEENRKKSKGNFSRGGTGGEISEYMKQQREEASKNTPDTEKSSVVDLTDDDVIVTKDTHKEEVCLGRLDGARVSAHKIPAPKMLVPQAGSKYWPAMRVELVRRPGGNTHIIGVVDPTRKDFGTIDVRTASALAPLMDSVKTVTIRLIARLDPRPRQPFEAVGQNVSDSYAITIVLFAQRRFVNGIGRLFSQRQVYLRDPKIAIPRDVEYVNPHEKKSFDTGKKPALASGASRYNNTTGGVVQRTQEEVKFEVLKIFESLRNTDDLPGMEPCGDIKTALLPHQKQALQFMTDREKDRTSTGAEDETSLWQENIKPNGVQSWYNVISGHEIREKPQPILGGILADVMGLGKTLNVLSVIMGSRDEAKAFSQLEPPKPKYDDDPDSLVFNTRGTLLVCPMSTIQNWEEQIKAHIKNGKKNLDYFIYHGQNRPNDPIELQDYELVITTYSVVAADADRRSAKRPRTPLAEINWFRIVLDEAHIIREQNTRQSKAICSLAAQRRWAVTGTPVQNRLDDLGALIKFLHIKPFDTQRNFSQYIISPFKTADPEILPKLRVLVDSITLRRNKDKLDLPGRIERIQYLKMSEQERMYYQFYAQQADKNVRSLLGTRDKLGGQAYAHILRAVLRLRLLCAHGSDLLSDEDWEASRGFTANTAIDLEDGHNEKPDRTPRQAFEMFKMLRDSSFNNCGVCQKAVQPKEFVDEVEDDSEDEPPDTFGFLTPCNHIICPECVDGFKAELYSVAGPDHHCHCKICETYICINLFELKQSQLLIDEEAQRTVRANPRLARSMGRYGGPHTKTHELLRQLSQSADWSTDHPEEKPIKSVVFSTWTNHLDLIQIALTENKYNFVRLDGSMTRPNRKIALDSFASSRDVQIILVSINAGGLGLNLTAASRVYVMEPQYNPAAESQAIERVHRLGQTRDVYIYRFIMSDSIEEKMLITQQKKRDLANMSMEKKDYHVGKEEAAKRRMEDLRSLFK
ncbi:MAG: hypothetical protein M1828_000578 [Chrysothrix sp. TS-e1954]|nr:MAG: hypothetical protein M1828_000578 [Chrysothrix sp. TS-e1954]